MKIRYTLFTVLIVLMTACSNKADIHKLYENSEDIIELKFKYAYSKDPQYEKYMGHYFYYFAYSKIRNEAQLKSMGDDGNGIGTSYDNVSINKFHTNDNQICLQCDGVRFIIKNAGESYILHMKSQVGPEGDWIDALTFHNSESLNK